MLGAVLWVALALHGGQAVAEPSCVPDDYTGALIEVSVVAPETMALCEPRFQTIEIRNMTPAPMEQVSVELTLPPRLGYAIEPGTVEASVDDGRNWRRVSNPLGKGTIDDPYLWTPREVPLLLPLSPRGQRGDRLRLRWRLVAGDQAADGAQIGLRAEARDQCGRPAVAPPAVDTLRLLEPQLNVMVQGRNLSRNGAFSDVVTALPGDQVEWRVEVENRGNIASTIGRVHLQAMNETGGRVALDGLRLVTPTGEQPLIGQMINFERIPDGARRVSTLREIVPAQCTSRVNRARASWGCQKPASGHAARLPPDTLLQIASRLETKGNADAVSLQYTITGPNQAEVPTDLAQALLVLRNDGPPLVGPLVNIDLPKGYVLDLSVPPSISGAEAAVRGINSVEIIRAENGKLTLGLTASTGAAVLDEGQELRLRFNLHHDGSKTPTDVVLSSHAQVQLTDGCGSTSKTPVVSTSFTPNLPELTVDIQPIGDPLVQRLGQEREYDIVLRNVGRATARHVDLLLETGDGWTGTVLPGCQGGVPGRMTCRVEGLIGIRPGEQARLRLPLRVVKLDGTLRVRAVANAMGSDGQGKMTPHSLSRAIAEGGAALFAMTQALQDAQGNVIAPDQQLALGDEVTLTLLARWRGAGGNLVSGTSIAQEIPPGLAFVSATQYGGDLRYDGVLTPAPGESGSVLWSLSPFQGVGDFSTRLVLRVVDPVDDQAERLLRADAVFSALGQTYGIDHFGDTPTQAEPLPVLIKRPEARLKLTVTRGGKAPPSRLLGRVPAGRLGIEGGDPLDVSVSIVNQGTAPAFMDWISLGLPAGIRLLPPATDGIDNDSNGKVDDAYEQVMVDLGENGPSWTSLRPPGAGGPGAGQRLDVGDLHEWHFRLQVSRDLPPEWRAQISLDGQFAAEPAADRRNARSYLLRDVTALGTPPVAGFFVLSGTSHGSDLSSNVLHDEVVEHRLGVRVPTGVARGLTLNVPMPPALTHVAVEGTRLSANLACPDMKPPTVRKTENGQSVFDWSLGDCRMSPAGDSEEPSAFVVLRSRVMDADPSLDAAKLAEWRRPQMVAAVHYDSAAEPLPVGRSDLNIGGPLLLALSPDGVVKGDAGDRFRMRVNVQNRGDVAANDVRVFLPTEAARLIDCASLRINGATTRSEAGHCGPSALLNGPLAPGAKVELQLEGTLARDLPLSGKGEIALALRADHAKGLAHPPARSAGLAIQIPNRQAPSVEVVQRRQDDGGSVPGLAIGDVLRLRGIYSFAEGRGRARLGLRLGVRGQAQTLIPSGEDPLAVLAVAVTPLDEGIGSDSLALTQGVQKVQLVPSMTGDGDVIYWADLGQVFTSAPKDGVVTRRLGLEAQLQLRDRVGFQRGRRLHITPVLALEGEAEPMPGGDITLGVVQEPQLQAAISHDRIGRSVQVGDSLRLHGQICNRGDAPARQVLARLGKTVGLVIEPGQLVLHSGDGRNLAEVILRPEGDALIRMAPNDQLLPGQCWLLDGKARLGLQAQRDQQVSFAVAEYWDARTAPEGRRYVNTEAAVTRIEVPQLHLSGDAQLDVSNDGKISYNLLLSTPNAGQSWQVMLKTSFEGAGTAPLARWAFFADSDGNGQVDAVDQRINWPLTMVPGQQMRLIAERLDTVPRPLGGVDVVQFVATATDGTGTLWQSTHRSRARVRDLRTGAVDVRRLLAVDRDCDGDTADESAQDALFEVSKDVARGECVVMRLMFKNTEIASLEQVTVRELVPEGTQMLYGSARFRDTPRGMLGRQIKAPDNGENEVVWSFIGSMAPGVEGSVEYRVKIND